MISKFEFENGYQISNSLMNNSYKVKFDIMLLTNIGMSSSWSIRKQLMLWVELDVQMKSVRKHATKY